jgi:hypothetical protein
MEEISKCTTLLISCAAQQRRSNKILSSITVVVQVLFDNPE